MAYSFVRTQNKDYTDSVFDTGYGTYIYYTYRFVFHEEFDPTEGSYGKTRLYLDKAQIKINRNNSAPMWGALRLNGSIKLSWDGRYESIYTENRWNYSDWSESETYWNSDGNRYVEVAHKSDGTADPVALTISKYPNPDPPDPLVPNYNFYGFNPPGSGYGVYVQIPDSYTASISIKTHAPHTLTIKKENGSADATYSHLEGYTQTIANPTRTGYTFTGWAKSGGGTLSGTTYTYGTSDCTLTANWQINTYTVSYNANGGSSTQNSQTKTYNVNLTLRDKISKASEPLSGYKVNFNANGGTVGTASLTAARTRKYTFAEWNTKASGTGGTSYAAKGTYSANASVLLYARWTSTTTTAAITLPTPTRTGFTFKGWATSASASSGVTGSYTPTGNITLYAIWEVKSYKLTISKGTGTTITVNRTASPDGHGDSGSLSNNATIYHNDVLHIVISANTGYNIGTHKVNNTTWGSGDYTVVGATTVTATATVKSYTLHVTKSDAGMVLNISRTSSPKGGASAGLLYDGDTLYHSDVIKVTYTRNASYTVKTATVNGNTITESGTSGEYTVNGVTEDVTVIVIVNVGGIVYIYDGNDWQEYQVYIYNGSSWEQYQAYIYDGNNWIPY